MKELRDKLRKLSIPQMKKFAEDFEIDVSKCRRKSEYIKAIVASDIVIPEDVDTFLSLSEEGKTASAEEEGMEPEEEVDVPESGASDVDVGPAGAGDEHHAVKEHIEREIDPAPAMEMLSEVRDRFDRGEHLNVPRYAKEMIEVAGEVFRSVERTGYAYILASAEHILNEMRAFGLDTKKGEKVLGRARTTFIKDADAVRRTIPDLEAELERLRSAQVDMMQEKIGSMEESIDSAKRIDAEVSEAEGLLQDAKDHYSSGNYAECLRLVQEADDIIQDAYRTKIQGITQLVLDIEAMIENARSVGVDTSAPEDHLSEAKEAFKSKDYLKCIEELNRADEIVSERFQEKLEEIERLKERQRTRLETKLLALIEESGKIEDPVAASRVEDMFDRVKEALDSNNIGTAGALLRSAEREVRSALTSPGRSSGRVAPPTPSERGAPSAGHEVPEDVRPLEEGPLDERAPAEEHAPAAPPRDEILPLQRPCKWCGYRGVEYYSSGVAKCPGCSRTYQWR